MRASALARRIGVVVAAGALTAVGSARIGRALVGRTEARLCPTSMTPPPPVSPAARELHRRLLVADLHADSLLWGRDLLRRSDRGQVDVPRLIEGNVAIQVLAVPTKSPRHLNIDRNDDRSDDITALALALGWPPATWRSLLARALHGAWRADAMARGSGGRLTLIRSARDLAAFVERRRVEPGITAAMLAVEGAHALDADPANVDVLADAGFRMMSPTHFFDNVFGGSAHGVAKGGLTDLGREMVERMEARRMLVDVAHASIATIDDVLAVARRPVIASHTGVRGTHDTVRNLSDDQLRRIAATGGLIGIGFFRNATGGDDVASIARAARHAADVVGIGHIALGSDFDGAVPQPIDAAGMVHVTDALLAAGLSEDEVEAVMGGNVVRLLAEHLPPAAD